jgi:hypothetical protein
MSSRSRPPSIETTSLLSDAPPSYHSTDDVSQPPTPRSESAVMPTPKYSNADMFWMLAGLWAGVFLGAFDGAWSMPTYRLLTISRFTRHCRGYPFDPNWKRVQCFKSSLVHRHIVPAIGLLLHAPLWCVLPGWFHVSKFNNLCLQAA